MTKMLFGYIFFVEDFISNMATSENNCKNLHAKLFQQLRQLAMEGEAGSRFPSEQLISQRYKVSRSTVNRVCNELESSGYLIRIQGSGTFIPATPLYRICYLLPFDDISNNHDTALVVRGEALRKRCLELGIPFEYIEASTARNSREFNSELFKQISKNTVLIISGYFFRKLFDQLIEQQANVVFINTQHELDQLYRERLKKWQIVEIDRRGGMVNMIAELKKQGCKNIAVLHNLPHHQHPLLRGYRLGLRLNKLEYKPQLVINMVGGVEYIQRRLDTLFELKSIYPFEAVIILSEHLAANVSHSWQTMDYPDKNSVKMAVVSNMPPQRQFAFDVLYLYPPSPETVTDRVMEASALNIPARKQVINMELTQIKSSDKK